MRQTWLRARLASGGRREAAVTIVASISVPLRTISPGIELSVHLFKRRRQNARLRAVVAEPAQRGLVRRALVSANPQTAGTTPGRSASPPIADRTGRKGCQIERLEHRQWLIGLAANVAGPNSCGQTSPAAPNRSSPTALSASREVPCAGQENLPPNSSADRTSLAPSAPIQNHIRVRTATRLTEVSIGRGRRTKCASKGLSGPSRVEAPSPLPSPLRGEGAHHRRSSHFEPNKSNSRPPAHSILMLPLRMTSPQRLVSAATCLPKSSGEPSGSVRPCLPTGLSSRATRTPCALRR